MDPALLKQQALFKARASQALEMVWKSTASTSHTTYEYVLFRPCLAVRTEV